VQRPKGASKSDFESFDPARTDFLRSPLFNDPITSRGDAIVWQDVGVEFEQVRLGKIALFFDPATSSKKTKFARSV
jgi:hypothetical protein